MASCDPMESPSGRACDDSTNRCRLRTASTISRIAGLVVIGGRSRSAADLVEQLLDAVLAGNRFVVVERELWRALQPQARADLAAQETGRAGQRPLGIATALLVAERRIVHARLLQIRADAHPRQRHEPDARIVNVAREQRRQLASDLIGDAIGSRAL